MSLSPVKTTSDTGIPVFANVIETLTGGFSVYTTGFTADAELPAGSMLYVNEATRVATPIKTAVVASTYAGSGTGIVVEQGHHFAAGNFIAKTVGAKAYEITAIVAGASSDTIQIKTAIDSAATGAVLFQSSATGSTSAAISTYPNALSHFSTTIASGEFVSAVVRGTVYANRMQPYVSGHLTNLKHIHVSTSY